MPGNFYAINSDLELVSKYPFPHIVARLDFKVAGDSISFAEAIAYNELVNRGIPVYIIEAEDPEFINKQATEHRFSVYRYLYADPLPDPPLVKRTLELKSATWAELARWEALLRKKRQNEVLAQSSLHDADSGARQAPKEGVAFEN